MQRTKILITGSSGQAGREIAKLLSRDFEIIGFDLTRGDYTTHIGNLNDWATINEITKGANIIIHTASLHAPHKFSHTRENFVDTNIKGTLYLLEAAKSNGVYKFIYTSTTSLYGESMDNPKNAVWVTEDMQPRPRDIYDITKLAAEELCRDFFESATLQTISLRVSRFWDEPLDKKVFYRMFRGLDVRDVALAHKLAIDKHLDSFELFNISAQSIFEKADIFELRNNCHSLLERRKPQLLDLFEKRNWQLPKFIDRIYVIDKAKKYLGYEPRFNIDQMIDELNREKANR